MEILDQQKEITNIKNNTQRYFIFHVDLDCFYASVEMRENPALKGIPIMVGGNKETKRGIVLTSNYEARKYGIKSGMSARKAIELCPQITCVKGNHSLYNKVSENVMTILSSYTDEFRIASIDEAYLNLTDKIEYEYSGNPYPLANEIKNKIYDKEKITCSIGIGPNTTIAKMATAQNKPNGITYVSKEGLLNFLYPLPITRILGIGPKTSESIKKKHNVETIGQIIDLGSEHEMIRKFGNLGKFFYHIISGQGKTSVEPNNYFELQSISEGRTFYGQLFDGELLTAEKILPKLIDDVHKRLIKRAFRYKTVTLEIKFQKNLQSINRSRSFLSANDDKNRIKITAYELLEEIKNYYNNIPIRKVAVRVSNLIKQDPRQKTISDFFP